MAVKNAEQFDKTDVPHSPGPQLEFNSLRLFVECHHTCTEKVSLTVSNPGFVAIYFTWQPFVPMSHHRRLHATGCLGRDQKVFVLACQSGSILPSESKVFHFLFAPHEPGIFTESWKMCTQPKAMNNGWVVTLRGAAVVHDAVVLKRRQLHQHLSSEQKDRQVASALEHILRGISAPEVAHAPMTPEEWREQHRFAAGTAHMTPPVYYKPGVTGLVEQVYKDLQASLVFPVDPKKKTKKGEKPSDTDIPENFDGRVDTLVQCVDKVTISFRL
jgi:hypothetical protein